MSLLLNLVQSGSATEAAPKEGEAANINVDSWFGKNDILDDLNEGATGATKSAVCSYHQQRLSRIQRPIFIRKEGWRVG